MNLDFIRAARGWGKQKLRPAHKDGIGTPRLGARARARWISERLSHAAFAGLVAIAAVTVKHAPPVVVARAPAPAALVSDKLPKDKPARHVDIKVEPIAPRVAAEVVKQDVGPSRTRFADRPRPSEGAQLPATVEAKAAPDSTLTESDKQARAVRADIIVPPVLRIAPSPPPRDIIIAEAAKRADKVGAEPPPRSVRAQDGAVAQDTNEAKDSTQSSDDADAPDQKTVKRDHGKTDDEKDAANSKDGKEQAEQEPAGPPAPIGVVKKREAYTVIDVWTEDQIAEGRKVCQKLLQGVDMVATDAPPIKEGACGAPAPVEVRSVGKPKVDIQPSAMLTCPMAAALNTWLTEKVQPAAQENFGSPVVRLISASSYACRNRYGQSNTPLSEHALVNALDLSGFVLKDGRTIRVLESWGPVARDTPPAKPVTVAENLTATSKKLLKAGMSMLGGDVAAVNSKSKDAGKANDADKASSDKAKDDKAKDDKAKDSAPEKAKSEEQRKAEEAEAKRSAFLHKVHADACDVFGTVLGPEANEAHRNHFHLDMKARKHRAYCQ